MRGRGLCVLAIGLLTLSARAALINFDSQPTGKTVSVQYQNTGVRFSAVNYGGGPNKVITFDTTRHPTPDHDLEEPWSVGNLAPGAHLKKILIIPENDIDNNHDGLVDNPDDEGQTRPSGVIKIKFTAPHTSFGLDLVDIDGPSEYNSSMGYLSFRSGGKEKARVGFGEFVNPASKFYDRTIQYADRSANRVAPITAEKLGISSFNEVQVNLGWSSAIDNIRWDENAPAGIVPEPAGLVLSGATLLLFRRRRVH